MSAEQRAQASAVWMAVHWGTKMVVPWESWKERRWVVKWVAWWGSQWAEWSVRWMVVLLVVN